MYSFNLHGPICKILVPVMNGIKKVLIRFVTFQVRKETRTFQFTIDVLKNEK